MFSFLYTIFSYLISLIIRVVAKFNTKIKLFIRDRAKGQEIASSPKKYWIHCASLGEYEMAVPVIEKLLETTSLNDLLITFFSPSGYKQAIKGKYAASIMYLPLDTKFNVRRFYSNYQPQFALFIRYDFWYNYIKIGLNGGTKFFLVNGRFTENHQIFRWSGKPYLRLLDQFNKVFVSDQESYNVLLLNGIKNIELTGDTRYDRVLQLKTTNASFPEIELFKGARKLLILGSSWKPEEEVLEQLLEDSKRDFAVIIAPHDLKRVDEIQTRFSKYHAKLYTNNNFNSQDKVLILDTIGMLSGIYKYAEFALIGGGFSGALHNILEPAVWGCHISFGPKINKFPEASDFIAAGFATKIKNIPDWIAHFSLLVSNENEIDVIADQANEFTFKQKGATEMIYKAIAV